jgi:hypothetical protein
MSLEMLLDLVMVKEMRESVGVVTGIGFLARAGT